MEDLELKSFLEKEKLKVDVGDYVVIEEVVFVIGMLEVDWRGKEGFVMDFLGLEDEDLD